jgi:hypothetical protein
VFSRAGLGQIATNAMTGQRWDKGLLLNVGLSLLTEGATSGIARGVGWVADRANAFKQTLGDKIQALGGWAQEKLAAAGSLAHEGWNRFKGWGENRSIQHAIERWNDPDLSLAERVKVEQFLREKGAEGLWQGGVADEGLGRSALVSRILEIGPGTDIAAENLPVLKLRGERTMLEALHEKYPNAQLGAVDLNPDALNALKEYYIDTGILPENTVRFNDSYTSPRLIQEFGQSDLVVNIAPNPDLIRSAGGARGYAEKLLNLTKPGGRVSRFSQSPLTDRHKWPFTIMMVVRQDPI